MTRFEVVENLTGAEIDVSNLSTLDEVCRFVLDCFPRFFVYRGGSHIAMHQRTGSKRLLLIIEVLR